jgi:hypothetical protein
MSPLEQMLDVPARMNLGRARDALRSEGFHPIGVDVSELLKAGGGVKCCTLELGAAADAASSVSVTANHARSQRNADWRETR